MNRTRNKKAIELDIFFSGFRNLHRIIRPFSRTTRALRRSLAACLAFFACTAFAHDPPLRILRQTVTVVDVAAPDRVAPTHRLRLTLALMRGTGWDAASLIESTRQAAAILAQCAIRTDAIELVEFEGPARYRSVFTPASRDLAKRLGLSRPTLFFLADTLNRPAFDAEAVGRGNSRTRPEMADTVWITYGARDLSVVIAHELTHVLSDSGEHSNEAGNLMREESANNATRLTADQCNSITRTGEAHGLLRPDARGWKREGASDVGRIQ